MTLWLMLAWLGLLGVSYIGAEWLLQRAGLL